MKAGIDPPNEEENMAQSDGRALIREGKIVIEFPLGYLPAVLEGAWASGSLSSRWRITDEPAFAKDLVIEMNRESENGTTIIHKMCDAAIKNLLEVGGEGIEEHPEQYA